MYLKFHCVFCKKNLSYNSKRQHLKSKKHLKNVDDKKSNKFLNVIQDINNIVIQYGIDYKRVVRDYTLYTKKLLKQSRGYRTPIYEDFDFNREDVNGNMFNRDGFKYKNNDFILDNYSKWSYKKEISLNDIYSNDDNDKMRYFFNKDLQPQKMLIKYL